MTKFVPKTVKQLLMGTALVATTLVSLPRPVQAGTTSTALIAAGAAAIVGALLLDGNNQPYYIQNNRKYYVTQDEAQYYRSHHHVVVRRAYVPENEYPVARNAGYQVRQPQVAQHPNMQRDNGQDHRNQDGGRQDH